MRIRNRHFKRCAAAWILPAAIALAAAAASPVTAQTVGYRATFDATWTAETHPTNYPSNAHFSGLVGGTHDATTSFWMEGMDASLGMKHMAEWGAQNTLLAEVQSAIDAGGAGVQIADDPLWVVPGMTSVEFESTPDFSRVTLVAMIAPSPDWFIGVKGLDLRPGGEWAEEIVVEVYPFDAGTDSGSNYTSFDNPTSPAVPISAITSGPFTPGVPIGTLTFTRIGVSSVPAVPGVQVSAYPNPFNPQTTIAWELPDDSFLTIEIFDIRGRRVRTLWDRATPAGPGQVNWNGTDSKGRMQLSGKYFWKLHGADFQETGSVILAK